MTDVEQRLAALEAEVGRLRDHVAVAQLIASYGPLADTALDADRRSKATALFTEDGVYDLGENWCLEGRHAIETVFSNEQHIAMERAGAAHIMALPHIVIDGDRATAVNYTHIHQRDGETYTTVRIAANFWELERRPDGWKVRYRRNRLLNGSDEGLAVLRGIDRVSQPPIG